MRKTHLVGALIMSVALALTGCAAGRPAARRAAGGTLAWTDDQGVSVRRPDGRTERLAGKTPSGLRWSPDGRELAWLTDDGDADGARRAHLLEVATGEESTWTGGFHRAAIGFTDGGLLALGPGGLVNLLVPGSRPRSRPTSLHVTEPPPEGLGAVPDGLLVAMSEVVSPHGGPQSIYLVAPDGRTRRLVDGADDEADLGNVPISSPAVLPGTVAFATGGSDGHCTRSDQVQLMDVITGRMTATGMPRPVTTGRGWGVRSLAWGRDGVLTAVLVDTPIDGSCTPAPLTPSVWRLERGAWAQGDEHGLRAAYGPRGQLALVTGQVTDEGEETGRRELLLVDGAGGRKVLGEGVRELAWSLADDGRR